MPYKTLKEFPAEFMTAWELAKEKKLSLIFPEKGFATNMKHRLHACRKALREEAGDTTFDSIDLRVTPTADGQWLLSADQTGWRQQIRAMLKEELG